MGFMKICTVIRRIGGLETYVAPEEFFHIVIRRIGGLETQPYSL